MLMASGNETLPTVGANPLGSNNGVGRVVKKVRRQPDLPSDLDDPKLDINC